MSSSKEIYFSGNLNNEKIVMHFMQVRSSKRFEVGSVHKLLKSPFFLDKSKSLPILPSGAITDTLVHIPPPPIGAYGRARDSLVLKENSDFIRETRVNQDIALAVSEIEPVSPSLRKLNRTLKDSPHVLFYSLPPSRSLSAYFL